MGFILISLRFATQLNLFLLFFNFHTQTRTHMQ